MTILKLRANALPKCPPKGISVKRLYRFTEQLRLFLNLLCTITPLLSPNEDWYLNNNKEATYRFSFGDVRLTKCMGPKLRSNENPEGMVCLSTKNKKGEQIMEAISSMINYNTIFTPWRI